MSEEQVNSPEESNEASASKVNESKTEPFSAVVDTSPDVVISDGTPLTLDTEFKRLIASSKDVLKVADFAAVVQLLSQNHVQFQKRSFTQPGQIHKYVLHHTEAAQCRIYIIQPLALKGTGHSVILEIPGSGTSILVDTVIGSSVAHGDVGGSSLTLPLFEPAADGTLVAPYKFQALVDGNLTTDDYILIIGKE